MVTDRVILVCTVIIALVYLYATTLIPTLDIGDPLGPKAFPRLLGFCLLVAAGLLFLEILKDRRAGVTPPAEGERVQWRYAGIIAGVAAWTCLYYTVFEKLGYIIATTIYLLALMAWFHRGKWVANVLTAVLFAVLSYVLFVKLDVRLPRGIVPFSWVSDGLHVVLDGITAVFKSGGGK